MKIILIFIFIFININAAENNSLVNQKEEESIKEKIFKYMTFLPAFLDSNHEDNKKAHNYNHFIAISYSPVDLLMPGTFSSKASNMNFINILYGQPNRFLRLPGRFMIDIGTGFGTANIIQQNDNITQNYLMFVFMGAMQEFILEMKDFYISGGLGLYIRNNRDERIGSNFVFGQKVAIGKVFQEKYDIQLFYRHFSNGYLAIPNNGFNYFGIQLGLRI